MAAGGGNDFQLVIPERGERVKICLGSTLIVSCHLYPAISAVDMEVTWYGTSCVCAYKTRKMTQGVDYEDRASLFIHDLMKGNVSLRVKDFRESDLGVYMCQVTSGNKTQQITVNVAEEVSANFKDVFTVDYKGEFSKELSNQSAYHGDSDNQPEDNRMGTKIQSTQASYHYESNRSQHGDSKMEVFCNNNFQLVAPSTAHDPEVSLGSDFIIPCHLSPGISALDMEIRWSKDTASVCLYKDRRLTEGFFFTGRVSLFMTHKLRKGNVSLLLKNFMMSDVGNYHCQVISNDRSEEITVRVRINPAVQPVSPSPDDQLLLHEFHPCHEMFRGDKKGVGTSTLAKSGGDMSLLQITPMNEDKTTREPSNELSRHTSHHSRSEKKQHGNYSMGVSSNDNFQLVLPQTTQESPVSLGSEFIVPCYLSPEICATGMQIKWFKETDCVCVYKNRHVTEGRAYKDRVSLITHELERGNVSLHLSDFSVSDVGDYHCQVISRDRAKEMTVGVRMKPEVQPVSQSPTSQDRSIQLMLFEIHKIWTEEETNKMEESALMSEMKANNVQELHQMLIRAYTERDRQLERTEQALRETRINLDRVLRLNPHKFLDRDNPNPFQ
ncbi:uncharacterized protein LOC143748971 isoform X2 [Siphateles boraxobius]|uniref:uncharacterized protein LOC143748971 isoform X2 n=1 Tax=Siphateles boraxobius TaxID=180520 RepID=UPI0040643CB1